MSHLLKHLFFLLFVRPLILVVLGLNVRHREHLPTSGPAVVVANHNSHLDVLVLMSLFPRQLLPLLRPVAARDYFCRNRLLSWFSQNVIGIIPFDRDVKGMRTDPLAELDEALNAGQVLILFPEGSRGEPEQLTQFKTGVAHIAARHPDVPIAPLYLHGVGKALPRGEALLVPFFVDVFVGETVQWDGDRKMFMARLNDRMKQLADEGGFEPWV